MRCDEMKWKARRWDEDQHSIREDGNEDFVSHLFWLEALWG